MVINVPTKDYRKDKLERQCPLHTHRLPVSREPGETYTTVTALIYIQKNSTNRFDLCKSPMSNRYSYASLCWPEVSSQSYTSPILRWTGNSLIWGKITAQLGVHLSMNSPYTELQLLFIYKKTANRPIWPMQISHTADYPAKVSPIKFTAANWWMKPKLTLSRTDFDKENDRPRGRSLYTLCFKKSSPFCFLQ